ncbi:MAG: PfkB family carbohydrate kinase [Thermodesulfobacteriota bacterium]
MRVFGLGQASLDLIARVTGFPSEDCKKEVLCFTEQGGGPVATALVSLTRLGVETAFAGVVSVDEAGRKIRAGLIEEGVDVGALVVREGGFSQKAYIIVNSENASRTILWKRPTVAELKPDEVKEEWLQHADFLLLDGLMAEASLRIARLAANVGVSVVCDAGSPRPGLLRLLPEVDYIVGSEVFSAHFSSSPEEAVVKIAACGAKAVTVTLGEKGSVTWQDGRVFSTPAFKVRALDTTGAGDVFHGGYIFGLLKGWPLEETVRFASAFAALKCLAPGGRAGIPGLAETMRFMKAGKRPNDL